MLDIPVGSTKYTEVRGETLYKYFQFKDILEDEKWQLRILNEYSLATLARNKNLQNVIHL